LRDGSNSDANIENKLGMPAQPFNSFDPSLFHERNPDEDAEAYEFPLQTPAGYPPACGPATVCCTSAALRARDRHVVFLRPV
jgi:hypothetical protein